jgi:hypothetical protein
MLTGFDLTVSYLVIFVIYSATDFARSHIKHEYAFRTKTQWQPSRAALIINGLKRNKNGIFSIYGPLTGFLDHKIKHVST